MPFQELSRRARGRLWVRLMIRLSLLVGVLVFFFLVGKPFISLCMPFFLALILTWILDPLIRLIHRKWKVPRGLVTILLIVLIVGGLGALLVALIWKGWSELSSLSGNWNDVWNTFQTTYYQLNDQFSHYYRLLPSAAQDTVNNLSQRLLTWLRDAASSLIPKTTTFAMGLPSVLLAFLFFLLATYFTAADYPRIRAVFTEHLPESARRVGGLVKTAFSAAFGGYIRAELILSAGVFVILLIGFLLMRQPYAVLLAALLAVLDFIPIIGSGTVLVPWAVVSFALGNWQRGMAILVIWGIVCLFRRLGEPKVVGNQTGLHPLLSLLSIYVGMKLWGVLGMIFAPVLLLVLINVWRAGVFHRTNADIAAAAGDIGAVLRASDRE